MIVVEYALEVANKPNIRVTLVKEKVVMCILNAWSTSYLIDLTIFF